MSSKPKNWPPALPYLTAPLHDKRLSRAQRQALTTTTTTTSPAAMAIIPAAWTASPAINVRIQAITDPDHPACGQHGLFAAQNLPPGAFVVVYLGRVHPGSTTKTNTTLAAAAAAAAIPTTNTNAASSSQESGPGQGGGSGGEESAAMVEPDSTGTGTSGDYDLWLDREVDVAVDAEREGNEARFVNDYRGVRERPNAEFGNGWCERWGQVCVGVWVVKEGKKHKNKDKNKYKDGGKGHGRQNEEEGKKKNGGGGGGGARKRGSGIRKGDEILVSYGKGFWGGRRPSASLS
ncbi:SET domain protein [Moelleriella libera RCEF 2490]|uniref:SET domain protein n=1 Tax=Moelleriella libera RCEF 2490 TaxID=1081109 RepID=A0A162IR34_9HYPO|nr:SET domain protein [Moelleriella libera RCEF 2490]